MPSSGTIIGWRNAFQSKGIADSTTGYREGNAIELYRQLSGQIPRTQALQVTLAWHAALHTLCPRQFTYPCTILVMM